jgi:hypothetical protein
MVQRLRSLPATALVEDAETGYRAWEVLPLVDHVTIDPA